MSTSIAFIEGIGGSEILVIMFVVLMLFGSDKLPGLARGMGKSIREFKKAAAGVEEEIRQAMEEVPDKPKPTIAPAKPADTVATSPNPPSATEHATPPATQAVTPPADHAGESHATPPPPATPAD
ncbi:MAG TPA: twin-arginine translocase TatA/TatE family subunit [Candidatus Didemnitutus sp.]|nr:twin-arginine translocase TatA/TatE family subunit [Candidatus Didemnitutus sp.]